MKTLLAGLALLVSRKLNFSLTLIALGAVWVLIQPWAKITCVPGVSRNTGISPRQDPSVLMKG